MSVLVVSEVGLVSALADLRSGVLLGEPVGPACAQLSGLAAAAPELFATDRISWDLIVGRLQKAVDLPGFADLVMLSPSMVHVALRLRRDPYLAVIGSAPRAQGVGLIVSEARTRVAHYEQALGGT